MSSTQVFAKAKKVAFEYFIETRYIAGVALEGWEVKAIRANRLSLEGAFIYVREGEVFLSNAHISPLGTANTFQAHDPLRSRKLLLCKAEINKLIGLVERKGYTLMPLQVFLVKNRIKVELALCKGKKLHDKRDALKDKDMDREASRAVKSQKVSID